MYPSHLSPEQHKECQAEVNKGSVEEQLWPESQLEEQ
jgi:hypothetical protein